MIIQDKFKKRNNLLKPNLAFLWIANEIAQSRKSFRSRHSSKVFALNSTILLPDSVSVQSYYQYDLMTLG